MPLDEQVLKQFEKWGKQPPTSEAHGTDETIRENMVRLKPKNWRLQGGQLIADTEMGPLVNYIGTDHILVGVDNDGLPILKKVLL